MVASGQVRGDPAQEEIVRHLDDLIDRLAASGRRNGGFLSRWRSRITGSRRGIYIYGDVGRGKTMLMDLFHAAAPLAAKRRVHFNEFMGEVHDRVHAARRTDTADAIAAVANDLAREARLLCLDEFMVTDIADAMILSRLFRALFGSGVTLVATSNLAPEGLYRDGLNRGLFLPFIDLLRQHCDVVALQTGTDYRLEKLTAGEVYVTPLGVAATRSLDAIFRRLTGRDRGDSVVLRLRGRDLHVPQAAAGVARFGFAELCDAPLGSGDYLAIARAFHTLIIDDVPILRNEQRDIARRLTLLVDTLYDHRVNLIASAAAQPADLYRATSGEIAQAFKRTVSRLIEMRSSAYLGAAHRLPATLPGAAAPPLAPKHQ
jgi:cell division protein ZapE